MASRHETQRAARAEIDRLRQKIRDIRKLAPENEELRREVARWRGSSTNYAHENGSLRASLAAAEARASAAEKQREFYGWIATRLHEAARKLPEAQGKIMQRAFAAAYAEATEQVLDGAAPEGMLAPVVAQADCAAAPSPTVATPDAAEEREKAKHAALEAARLVLSDCVCMKEDPEFGELLNQIDAALTAPAPEPALCRDCGHRHFGVQHGPPAPEGTPAPAVASTEEDAVARFVAAAEEGPADFRDFVPGVPPPSPVAEAQACSAPGLVVCDHCPEFAHPLDDDGTKCVNPRPAPQAKEEP